MGISSCSAAIAAIGLATAPATTTPPDPDATAAAEHIELGSDNRGRMTVPVTIANRGPLRFVVDTGSERTVISEELAGRLGLESRASEMLVTITDRQRVEMVTLPPLSLGRNQSINLYSPVLKSRNIGADGILGLDSLGGMRVEIQDYGRCLQISQGDAVADSADRGKEIRIHARERQGQLIMVGAEATGFPVYAILDTGAEINIGNRRLLNLLKTRGGVTIVTEREITGVTGKAMLATIGYIGHIRIGDAVMDNLAVAFVDSPALERLGLADDPTLILGMNTMMAFERVRIDFPRKLVTFVAPKAGIFKLGNGGSRTYGQ